MVVSIAAPSSTTRRAILLVLKRQGEARAEDLAVALGITPSAVRQHLTGLVAEGLVALREQRGRAGRPRFFYSVTAQAEPLFPKAYGGLANELLEFVDEDEPGMVDRMFARRRERRVEAARSRLAGKPFEERIAELTRILDEDGYLAEVEISDGAWWIVEHNCAILEVALRYGQACASEIGFLREVMPDADIDRVSHMASGDHRCAYRVRPGASNALGEGTPSIGAPE
jgi:predicted ArsR family transcriptional regulator